MFCNGPIACGTRMEKTSNVISVNLEQSERAASLWLMDTGVMVLVLEGVNSIESER